MTPAARRIGFVAVALLLAATIPASVLAARAWQVSANPSTLTYGVSTTVEITVRDTGNSGGGAEITCVRIQVPGTFTITSIGIVSVYGQTSGAAFSAWQALGPTAGVVAFKDPADDHPLIGSSPPNDVAVFSITGKATSLIAMTWTATAADHPGNAGSTSCGSGSFPASTLPFVVLPVIVPTPTPGPTASPTPTPTATPAPTPTATPKPSPTRTATPVKTPGPTPTPPGSAGATPTSTSTPIPTAESSSPPPSAGASDPQSSGASVPPAGASPPPDSSTSDPGAGGGGLTLPGGDRTAGDGAVPVGGLSGAVSTALDSLPGGLAVWAFPAFVMSVPGLLLILAIAAQAFGALAWLPVVRRRLGASDSKRGARR